MKNKIYIVLFFFAVFYSNAKSIDETTAKLIGKNFLTTKISDSKIYDKINLTLVYKESSEKNNGINKTNITNYFYIFSFGNNGFIIISADDRVTPVLGYSLNNKFRTDNMPPNISFLLNGYKQEIEYSITNNISPSNKIVNEWNVLKNTKGKNSNKNVTNSVTNTTNAVSPLVQIHWDQSPYYNALCPGGSVTGCVATAMAQAMKYWDYPNQGTGSHSYTHPTYGMLSADFGATTYQWDNMPSYLDSSNNAVATLMYHCGVSVDMNYSPTLSGSSISTASSSLKTYFGYDLSTQFILKSSYTDATWITTIENEINDGRPVIYGGYNGSLSGHAWICDGYDVNDYLHFNWGWSGSSDGYFQINNFNYMNVQQAIIGIKPLNFNGIKLLLNVVDYTVDLCSQVNQSLSLTVPNSTGFQTFQWLKDGVTIPGATSSNYTVNSNDVGSKISCTGANANGITFITNKVQITQNLPTSAFTYTKTGLTVNFTNSSSCSSQTMWDFGDGSTSTAINPSHTYSSLGVYNVCLTNTNGIGSKQYCEYIPFFNTSIIDEMNNVCYGVNHNTTFNNGQCSQAVKFTRNSSTDNTQNTSSVYPYNSWVPRQGTLEFLVNVTNGSTSNGTSSTSAYLLDLGSSANYHNFIHVFSNGRIEVSRSYPGNLTTYVVANTSSFTFNQWHVISISYGNLGTKIAVDGVVYGTNTAINYNMFNGNLILGHFNYDSSIWYGFEGLLDRFRISNSQNDFQLNTSLITPTFTQVASICSGSALSALPTTSINGITGTWSPALNNTATTTYTFTPTVGQCSSTKTMTISVSTTPTPSASAQTFCSGTTVGNLINSTNLLMYNSSSGGTSLPNSTIMTTGTYYISQILNGCESARSPVSITINTTSAPVALAQNLCNGSTVANLTASGLALKWYNVSTGGSVLASNTVLTSGTYYVTQTLNSCESNRTAVNVTISTTAMPVGNSNQSFIQGQTIADIVVSGLNILWYTLLTDASNNINPLPITTQIVNGNTYYAVQTQNGCRSSALAVTASVTLNDMIFDANNFLVYPNPFDDKINISSSEEIQSIKMFNLLGRKIKEENRIDSTEYILNLENIPQTVYILEITTDKGKQRVKVIKR